MKAGQSHLAAVRPILCASLIMQREAQMRSNKILPAKIVSARIVPASAACLLLAACQQTNEVADANRPAPACFSANEFQSWRATPDTRTMYVRVGANRYYRLDMAGTCPALRWPSAFLITTFRGPTSICSHLDWDLKVSEPNGIPTPCIVQKMTPMTPAEAAALPPAEKP
jgi:Family of unknown function (DUF6491)